MEDKPDRTSVAKIRQPADPPAQFLRVSITRGMVHIHGRVTWRRIVAWSTGGAVTIASLISYLLQHLAGGK